MTISANMSREEKISSILMAFVISLIATAFIIAVTQHFNNTSTATDTGVMQWSSDTASWKGGW